MSIPQSRAPRAAPRGPRVSCDVTQDIINAAIPRNSGHCVIADAVKEAVPEARGVSVDLQTIRWTDNEKQRRYIYLTPRVAQVALVKFDQGIPPEPFNFMLRGAQSIALKKNQRGPKRMTQGEGSESVHEVKDGAPPPMGALASGKGSRGGRPRSGGFDSARGLRRSFGLRALEL